MQIFKVIGLNGIAVHVEANNHRQAVQRAQSPLIIREFTRIIQSSLSEVTNVEPLRGPTHQVRSLVFTDEFFNN